MRMNPDVKAKWIERLRSGLYPQTKGNLQDQDGFCCLGVLCDLSGLGQWTEPEPDFARKRHYVVPNDKNGDLLASKVLPRPVKAWAGLEDENPSVRCDYPSPGSRGWLGSLAILNDGGLTFAQIADVIEYFF